jgi:hypothetical protein
LLSAFSERSFASAADPRPVTGDAVESIFAQAEGLPETFFAVRVPVSQIGQSQSVKNLFREAESLSLSTRQSTE